jgi:hypothetical protein
MVYLLPLYHPRRLTDEICMLDQMGGGRRPSFRGDLHPLQIEPPRKLDGSRLR